jgi:hypothetical protein
MTPPNTVIERGLGGPVCGECGQLLPVSGKNNRVCLKCFPEREIEFLDEREQGFLREMMDKKEMSATATMRHMFRLGQAVDYFLAKGLTLAFINPATGETETPFNRQDKKLAPMPGVGNIIPMTEGTDPRKCPHCPAPLAYCVAGEYCSAGCGYIDGHYWPKEKKAEPVRNSCNRHSDCAAATAKFKEKNGRDPGFSFHCHDDECEDCFGT